jgi:hypothetical protein
VSLLPGYVPNGHFWEGIVQYLTGDVASQAELDCEAGMFCARGDRGVLDQLREELEGYIENPKKDRPAHQGGRSLRFSVRRLSAHPRQMSALSTCFELHDHGLRGTA